MKVILVINYKGGVGKSTIAVNLAHAFKAELKTYLMDMDSQNSLSLINWDGIEKMDLTQFSKLDQKEEGLIVVDTPPYLMDNFDTVLSKADFIIIPTKASFFDIASCKHTVSRVLRVMNNNKKMKAGILLNMTKSSTSLTSDSEDVLRSFGIPLMNTKLSDRVSFIRSVGLQNGIYSTGDAKAEKEFNALVKEILIKLAN